MPGNMYYHLGAYWYAHVTGDCEIAAANLFMGDLLTGSPDLADTQIYQGTPPEDQPYPLIAYGFAGAEDDDSTYAGEEARLIYLVQVIDQIPLGAPTDTAIALDKIVKALLQGASGANAEGDISMIRRKQPYEMEETRMEGM